MGILPTVLFPTFPDVWEAKGNKPQVTVPRSDTASDPFRSLQDVSEQLSPDVANLQRTADDAFAASEAPARRVKGLPVEGDLFKLAGVYLEVQGRLWPKLQEAALLPIPSFEATSKLSTGFTDRFTRKVVEPFIAPPDLKLWKALGTSYVRYSSAQQNPRSLDDQLVIQLNRARTDDVFIPWHYVFADAGVTGTIAARTGYGLAKQALALLGAGAIEVLYVDEIARATRDGIETLLLGHFVQTCGKRMIGVSDGFDSADQFSKMKLHFFAMFNEQFVDQHRQKVLRGKSGAARRGTLLGRCPLGLKAVPAVDGNGVPMRVRNGNQANTFGVDPETRHIVELLAQRFVDERRSAYQIAREFNRLRMGGRATWTQGTLLKMLRNPLYTGIYVYNRVKHVKDPVTGKTTLVIRPRTEWHVRRFPQAQIWRWERWKQIRARLREIEVASPVKNCSRVSRNAAYPTTLLSGTIFCGYCGSELKLYRSDGVRRQFGCPKGRDGRNGCVLRSSKSTRILESAILNHVRGQILTPDTLSSAVKTANNLLCEEASLPSIDTKPFRTAVDKLARKRDRLIELVADGAGQELGIVRQRLAAIDREMRTMNEQIRHADAASDRVIPPIDEKLAIRMLQDMRSLLNQDVPRAALALQILLGKVYVRYAEEPTSDEIAIRRGPGRTVGSGKPWVATISPRPLELLSEVAAMAVDDPDSSPLVNLKKRNWIPLPPERVIIFDTVSHTRQIAAEVTRLVDSGLSVAAAASALGVSDGVARAGHEWYLTTAEARATVSAHTSIFAR